MWDQWSCTAINSRTRKSIKGEVFVRAKTRTNAARAGELLLRRHGITGRIKVFAVPYYPWTDRAFRGFIQQVEGS